MTSESDDESLLNAELTPTEHDLLSKPPKFLTEHQRKLRRQLQNRLAAQGSRHRKRRAVNDLQDQVEIEHRKVRTYRLRIAQLENVLRAHNIAVPAMPESEEGFYEEAENAAASSAYYPAGPPSPSAGSVSSHGPEKVSSSASFSSAAAPFTAVNSVHSAPAHLSLAHRASLAQDRPSPPLAGMSGQPSALGLVPAVAVLAASANTGSYNPHHFSSALASSAFKPAMAAALASPAASASASYASSSSSSRSMSQPATVEIKGLANVHSLLLKTPSSTMVSGLPRPSTASSLASVLAPVHPQAPAPARISSLLLAAAALPQPQRIAA